MGIADRDYNRAGGGRSGGGGGDFGAALRKFLNWSFPVGTYIGVGVRVHITFLLLLAFWVLRDIPNTFTTLQWMSLLFGSVLLHEFGHIIGCRLTGGRADAILIWPLGGLATCQPVHTVKSHFITTACGPLVNVFLCIIAWGILAPMTGTMVPVTLNPFDGNLFASMYVGSTLQRTLFSIFAVNYILLLFNLALLFYPFDGGRLVQAALWKFVGYAKSMRIALTLGMIGAVAVGFLGLFNNELMLILIAFFGFMTCYQSKQQLHSAYGMREDYGDSYSTSDDKGPGFFAKRKQEKAAKIRERDAKARAVHEAEVDRILEKVSTEGMHSLSKAEQRTLADASKKMKAS